MTGEPRRSVGRTVPRRGLRREAPLVLAGALLVFVALAGFTLLGYRGAVLRLEAERTEEARLWAERLALEAERAAPVRFDQLARLVPAGSSLALFEPDGRLIDAVGHADPPLLAVGGFALGSLVGADAAGPRVTGLPVAIGVAPFTGYGGRRFVRVDLPAAELAGQLRGLAWLTPAVVLLSLAAAVVVVLFVRALARPYEELLARARAAGAPLDSGAGEDELAGLVATFDRALAALAAGPGPLDQLRTALGDEQGGGFLLLDREGTLLAATPAAGELLGVAKPETGVPIERALAGRPEIARLLADAVASGTALSRGAARIDGPAGAAMVGITAEPLQGDGGRPRGWLVVVADWTEAERSAARERLADGLAQLGELSAGVAHELRNSLATLSGWVTLARREALPAAAEECLAEVARESAQLARIVEDFLAFARPGTRRLERIDLVAVVRGAIADPALAPVGVELVAPPTAELEGDAELLERALRNLLANAARAERERGREGPVEVTIARAAMGWELTLADRGPGVPEEIRARLFEPFASASPGGAGLGLALTRRILVLHGGAIALEDRPGGGTVVRIQIPSGVDVTTSLDALPLPALHANPIQPNKTP